MNKRRTAVLVTLASVILVTGILLSFFSSSLFGNTPRPIVLPDASGGALVSGEGFDFPLSEDDALAVEITTENVRQVVASLSRPETYVALAHITLFWDGGSSGLVRQVWVRGTYVRVDYIDLSNVTKSTALSDGSSTFFWTQGSAQLYRGQTAGESLDDLQGMPTYEAIASLDAQDILEAGRVNEGDKNYIYVRASEPGGYVGAYTLSADTGLLTGYERYMDGQLVFSAAIDTMNTTVDDAMFLLPTNEYIWDVE